MKKLLLFLLLPVLSYGQVQIGDDINGEAAGDFSGRSISLSSNGNIVAIAANQNDANGVSSGHVRIFENQSGGWTQIGQDIDGENEGDQFGQSISLSSNGDIIAIGATLNDGNGEDAGHVRVFENQGGNWVQIGADIDGEAILDESGSEVKISDDGSIIAIGAFGNDSNGDIGSDFGHVRVFENQGGSWIQIGQDIDGEAMGDISGSGLSLSANGSIIAISGILNDGNGVNSGHVRVFEIQGGSWIQIGQDIDGEAANDFSGANVSLSSDGTIIAISAPRNDGNGGDSGQVRIYENQGGNWVQIGADIDGEVMGDISGESLSLSSEGNIVAIGATLNDGNGEDSGHVRVFENQGGNWAQIGADIDGEALGDNSGQSISLSSTGSFIAIGAPGNNDNGENSGHVRVYDISEFLSIKEFKIFESEFTLYPNPASTSIQIDLRESNSLQKATIYNSLGQEVLQSTQTTIDVSSLSKGVYLVEVQTSTGKGSEKLIIN